jgi:hypothetical protein
MLEYPHLLGNTEYASPTLSEQADTYILDSTIGNDDVGNDRVIKRTSDIDPDVVVPADVWHDQEATTERVLDLVAKLGENRPTVMIPLQPDDGEVGTHSEHYYQLTQAFADQGLDVDDEWLAVGGVKDWSMEGQLRALVEVREAIAPGVHLHGLGFGASPQWITTLREAPDLVDSIDMSSVANTVTSNKMLTPEFEYVKWGHPRGTNSSVLSAMIQEYVLYQLTYYLGPDVRESDVPTEPLSPEIEQILDQHSTQNTSIFVPADD